MFNLAVLRTKSFYIALAVALGGLALSTGLVMDGSKAAEVVGWLLTLLGVVSGRQLPAPTE